MAVVASGGERLGRLSRLMRRLRSSAVGRAVWRVGFGERHEWLSLLLVWLTLSVAVWSIERAAWIQPQPSLLAALVVAVFAGHVLVRTKWRTSVVYAVMVVLGLAAVIWQAVGLFVAPGVESALASWWDAVSGGRPSEGTVYFAMFLVFITWTIGFAATWFVLRRRNAWLAAAFGGLIMLVNLSNLPLANVAQVEVYRGAASEGSGMGGTVHIRTRSAEKGQKYGGSGSWGSFDTRGLNVLLSGRRANTDYLLMADYSASDNNYQFLDDNGTEYNANDDARASRRNNDFASGNVLGKWGRRFARGRQVTVQENLYWKRQGIPGISNNQFSTL